VNLFILDRNPIKAAEMYCDKHVCKIILESAQMMAMVHWIQGFDVPSELICKSHKNNHVSKWVRQTTGNYEWTGIHAKALCSEYTYRYGKTHKWNSHIDWLATSNSCIRDRGMTEFRQAVDDPCRDPDPVLAYRKYYMTTKRSICKWDKGRPKPRWFI